MVLYDQQNPDHREFVGWVKRARVTRNRMSDGGSSGRMQGPIHGRNERAVDRDEKELQPGAESIAPVAVSVEKSLDSQVVHDFLDVLDNVVASEMD